MSQHKRDALAGLNRKFTHCLREISPRRKPGSEQQAFAVRRSHVAHLLSSPEYQGTGGAVIKPIMSRNSHTDAAFQTANSWHDVPIHCPLEGCRYEGTRMLPFCSLKWALRISASTLITPRSLRLFHGAINQRPSSGRQEGRQNRNWKSPAGIANGASSQTRAAVSQSPIRA